MMIGVLENGGRVLGAWFINGSVTGGWKVEN